MNRAANRPEWRAVVWLAIILATASITVLQGGAGIRVETNLMALMPSLKRNHQVENAERVLAAGFEQKIVLLLAANTAAQAVDAALELKRELEQSRLFHRVGALSTDREVSGQYRALYPFRYQLLSDRTRHQLETEPQRFVEDALKALYSPAGIGRATNLKNDPFYLLGDYLQQSVPGGISLERGIPLLSDGASHYALMTAELDGEAFDLQHQARLLALVERLSIAQTEAGRQLYAAGLPLYAAAGSERAQQEIRLVGAGSCLGVILLLVLSFGSVRPLLLALLAVAAGVFGAWCVGSLVFGKLHVLTLVFGASLIGVAVDYCLHYFCGALAEASPQASAGHLRQVVRGITLALITSAMAYLCLATAPFPGLRQIAIFSAAGLVFAWLTVVMLFPLLLQNMRWRPRQVLLNKVRGVADGWGDLMVRYRWLGCGLLILVVAGIGALRSEDDVRQLQTPDAELQRQDRFIQALVPGAFDSRYFVVGGATIAEVLRRETQLTAELERLVSSGSIAGYYAMTQNFPLAEQQQANYRLLKRTVYDNGNAQRYLASLGFSTRTIEEEYRAFAEAQRRELVLRDWLAVAGEPWRSLWLGCDEAGCGAVVRLAPITDIAGLSGLTLPAGVNFVDTVHETSTMMALYRVRTGWLLLLGVVAAWLLLGWRRGWREAVAIMLVPVVAIGITLGVLGWLGEPLNLFRVFALLLVLGIGADFGIFAARQRQLPAHTALAIALSALTTLLAFGLLSLSDTEIVRSFGQTLLIGITSAVVVAPVVGRLTTA